jgi:mannosylglycerate synthase
MCLVVFPFKKENPQVVLNNVKIAAQHPRVEEVLCVGVEKEETYRSLEQNIPTIKMETNKEVNLILQERIGSKRSGKGDGMNTALKYFLEETDLSSIMFFDSDITTFGPHWITKALEGADMDYPVVRHYFPRASTDAMITWMITKTGFALLWPTSELPWIEQPLGGELPLKRSVVEKFVQEEAIMQRSDWGIDTMYTFYAVKYGYPMLETYISEGKLHKLYGKLSDLKTMLVECFDTIQSLKHESLTPGHRMSDIETLSICSGGIVHRAEHPHEVPPDIFEKIGFDIEGSLTLLIENWTPRMEDLLELFPRRVRDGLLANKSVPSFSFMDEHTWRETYYVLLEHFDAEDEDWQELIFKLWTSRVLCYTTAIALRGYFFAMRYLYSMIDRYMNYSAKQMIKKVKGRKDS